MKLKNISILFSTFTVFSLLLTSCEIDNYDPPSDGIKGALIDSMTNTPFQAGSQSRIRLFEEKYGPDVLIINLPTKPDGTFENSPIFGGKYRVLPIEGAFFPADTTEVDLKGVTEVNLKVQPFLRLTATAVPLAGSVAVTYKISRSRVGGKITQYKTLLSTSPLVSNTIRDQEVAHVEPLPDADILAGEYTDTISGLQSGTYYVRAAALATNSLNSYNYSEVIKIQIP